MSPKISKELAIQRLEQAKEELEVSKIREDSDYDDEFIVKKEETETQIKTAEELLILVEKYVNNSTRKNINN